MASAAVMIAVKERLDAFWSRTPIEYPNETFQPPAEGDPFLALQYPLAQESAASIGAPGENLQREEGAIRFVLMIPRGAGVIDWTVWLDELRAHFRHRDFGPVRTSGASPAVLDDRNDDGNYWALSCAVAYEADFLG